VTNPSTAPAIAPATSEFNGFSCLFCAAIFDCNQSRAREARSERLKRARPTSVCEQSSQILASLSFAPTTSTRAAAVMVALEKHQPSEREVVEAYSALLSESPALGITKVLTHLQKEKEWALSEKRLKSILISAGLRPSASTQNKATSSAVPISRLDPHLPIPDNVRAVYFDKVKGKGLVASRDFAEGETIFTEDALISAPPSHALKAVENGELCTHCFAPLSGLLVVPCGKPGCQGRFCNRLCQSRAQSLHHALLCPGQNASIKVRCLILHE
jgi:hypothetical protein